MGVAGLGTGGLAIGDGGVGAEWFPVCKDPPRYAGWGVGTLGLCRTQFGSSNGVPPGFKTGHFCRLFFGVKGTGGGRYDGDFGRWGAQGGGGSGPLLESLRGAAGGGGFLGSALVGALCGGRVNGGGPFLRFGLVS